MGTEDSVLPVPILKAMSFDLFLFRYVNGELAGFPLADLGNFFPCEVRSNSVDCLQVDYGGSGHSNLYFQRMEAENEMINSLNVNRPIAESRLYEGIFELMRRHGLCLVFPGSRVLVADVKTIAHLPPEMPETMDGTLLVQDGLDILNAISNS